MRLAKEHQHHHNLISTILRAHAGLINCGIDPIVEKLAEEQDFGRYDLNILRILFGAQILTVVAAPKRVWKDQSARRALHKLKRDAFASGIRILLCPGGYLEKSSRYNLARALAASRSIRPTRGERLTILSHVLSNGGSSLEQCVAIVSHHSDPVGLILNLCATRWLRLKNSGQPLSPATKILPMG